MTKIVRKWVPGNPECGIAFWLDDDNVMRGWYIYRDGPDDADEAAASGQGWMAGDGDFERCGTTLAALRAELTEEGEG